MKTQIVGADGQPANPIERLMLNAERDMNRIIDNAIYQTRPRLIDQHGKDILPPDPKALDGLIETLSDTEKGWA